MFTGFLVTVLVFALIAAAVFYFNRSARAKAKALVLSELAVIRAAEAKTAADLKAKAAAELVQLSPKL